VLPYPRAAGLTDPRLIGGVGEITAMIAAQLDDGASATEVMPVIRDTARRWLERQVRAGSSIPAVRASVATVLVISGKLSIPALGSLNAGGRAAQTRLAERGVPGFFVLGALDDGEPAAHRRDGGAEDRRLGRGARGILCPDWSSAVSAIS
jgi:hypothetical protein